MSSNVLAACITATVAVGIAVLGALSAYFASKRERRRLVYSEAVKSATSWHEMLYRVRRRHSGQEVDLVDRFHELQDELSFHHAWIGSESRYMKRSYDRLVAGSKERTAALIVAAWDAPIRPIPGNALPDDKHPDLSDLTDAFLLDVRSHLSPIFLRKISVMWRNRKPA